MLQNCCLTPELVCSQGGMAGAEAAAAPRPLGVFWDIENCAVPSGKSAISVCDKIRRQEFFRGHREIQVSLAGRGRRKTPFNLLERLAENSQDLTNELQFAVVCDATKESRVVLEELDKAQVDIFHVAANRKNAADDKLKQIMRRFADIHRDGARIVLISGDMDFAADIADFKGLCSNSNGSEVWSRKDLVLDRLLIAIDVDVCPPAADVPERDPAVQLPVQPVAAAGRLRQHQFQGPHERGGDQAGAPVRHTGSCRGPGRGLYLYLSRKTGIQTLETKTKGPLIE